MNTDLISRSALLEQMLNHYEVRNPKQKATIGEYCMMVIHAPAVDAVIPVRCAQCKHFKRNLENDTYCSSVNGLTDPEEDDFCSYGERKEGAD